MSFRTLLTASLLSGLLPLTSQAQTAPASSRFYVGVGANMLSNVPFKDQGVVPRIIGPSLTAGMQLTPRLAVQAGLSYHQKNETYEYLFAGPGIASTIKAKYFLVPVLARYTVTEPTAHFHFDVLGGATLIHATSHISYTNSAYESDNANTQFNLSVGPAVRAALSSHFELTASGLVSATVGDSYYEFSDRLFLNTSIGVNYTFGSR